MLDRKEHCSCLEHAGHTRVKIHILLMKIASNVAQWEVDPSESTQPRNALTPTCHCADEMKLLRAHSSPAQGWEHCESKPCQDTQLMGTAGSREMQDLSFFRGEHHSGHPPACPSELIVEAATWNPLLRWKGAALALRNGGWNVFHSHLSEIPYHLRELLSNWCISRKEIRFSLCNAFPLQTSKYFTEGRVENQAFTITKGRVVV